MGLIAAPLEIQIPPTISGYTICIPTEGGTALGIISSPPDKKYPLFVAKQISINSTKKKN